MGTHPIFESDFDCLTEQKKMSEIVYAAGEGPTTPRMKGAPAQVELKKTGMSRAKTWTEEAEENFRFQEAGFLDGREFESLFPTHQIARGESGHFKKPAFSTVASTNLSFPRIRLPGGKVVASRSSSAKTETGIISRRIENWLRIIIW